MIRLGISAEYSHMIIQSYDHMVFHKIKQMKIGFQN